MDECWWESGGRIKIVLHDSIAIMIWQCCFLPYRIRMSKGLPDSAAWQIAQKNIVRVLLYGAFR